MKNRDIVCVSMTTWEGDYMKTIVHMMSHLAKRHRVLFVDYTFTWKDVLWGILGKSAIPIKRILGWHPRLRKLTTRDGDSIYHLTLPPIIPINWIKNPNVFEWFLPFQTKPVRKSIRNTMHKLNFKDVLMINAFHPVMGWALHDSLSIQKSIYYCYDEINAAKWAGVHGGRFEQTFVPIVDGLVVTSSQLFADKSDLNPHVALIKNGVDFDLYHSAIQHRRKADTPVIGYLGSVDDRLDADLLEKAITYTPDFDWHFVGRVVDKGIKERLGKHSNVSFFGAQSPFEIPYYLGGFSIGIIPFLKNDFTKSIYPLKINEYLAAGLPVVATDFSDLSDFEEYITIVLNDASLFLNAVRNALRDTDNLRINERYIIAKSNSWQDRVSRLEEFIDQIIADEKAQDQKPTLFTKDSIA